MIPVKAKAPAPAPAADPGVELLLPAGQNTFRTWEVAQLLRHSRKHIENLVAEGALGPVIDARGIRSTRSSAIITRAGLVAFLRKRKI